MILPVYIWYDIKNDNNIILKILTLINKRMTMMTSECSGRAENIKFLVVLPLIVALLLCVFSCRDKSDSQKNVKGEVVPTSPPPSGQSAQPLLPATFYVFNGDTAWVEVDEMPKFPGGEAALIKYIFDFIIYPFDATAEGVQGKVIAEIGRASCRETV